MSDMVFQVIKLLVMLLGAVIGLYVLPYLRGHAERGKLKEAAFWVGQLVLQAQQVMEAKSGKERKAYVADALLPILEDIGIRLTDEQIDTLIEAAVKSMKMGEK